MKIATCVGILLVTAVTGKNSRERPSDDDGSFEGGGGGGGGPFEPPVPFPPVIPGNPFSNTNSNPIGPVAQNLGPFRSLGRTGRILRTSNPSPQSQRFSDGNTRQSVTDLRQSQPFNGANPTTTLKTEMCPCVRGGPEGTCLAYDRRYQAATLAEAMENFVDMITDSAKPETVDPVVSDLLKTGLDCGRSAKCLAVKGCMQMVLQRMVDSAQSLSNELSRNATIAEVRQLSKQFGLKQDYRNRCQNPKLRDSGTAALTVGLPPLTKQDEPELKRLYDAARREVNGRLPGGSRYCANRGLSPQACKNWLRRSQRTHTSRRLRFSHRTRSKRHVAELGPGNIVCSYRRGQEIVGGTNDGWVGLCNLCWSWRALDVMYSPRWVNELTCESYDNQCISGWGECRERKRELTVFRETVDGKGTKASVFASIACECHVAAASIIHNLVSR